MEIEGMVSIFNYGFPVAETAFADAGVKYRSLTNYGALIELAIEKRIITEDQEALLLQWRNDPAAWGR